MKIGYTGSITEIRAIEDCIRATKKYTEGVLSKKHPRQIQGEDFPSRVLHKHYEFYPNVKEISWNMPVNVAMDWLFSDTPCVKLSFKYDYRTNTATATVLDARDVDMLTRTVPGFTLAIQVVGKQGVLPDVATKPVQRVVNA